MSKIDLAALKIDDAQAAVPKPPLGPRLLIGGVVLLSLAVAATFLWPILVPPRAVRMAPVRAAETGVQTAAAAATTEAVGWVEADPFLHVVRPLVNGRIETLAVLEGAQVVAGETVVARLESAELVAARDRAVAAVADAEAGVARAAADLALAEDRLRQNAESLLRVADAKTRLAAAATKVAAAAEELRQAEAEAASAAATADAQARLAEEGQSHAVALERARADAAAARAKAKGRQEQLAGLRTELAAQRDTLALCEQLADDPVDLRGAVAQGRADVVRAEAMLGKARTEQEIAERELGWAVVRSPVSGVVMRLEAEPGAHVGAAGGVVALYDPKKLRARIDVPIDSLAGIHAGQRVEVTSEATGSQVIKGVVQRLQHETDMLKNTLQVKIGLEDPPPLLRPETLCRARFLAPARDGSADGGRAVSAFRVPREAVRGGAVFVFDPATKRARRVAVDVVTEEGGDAVVRGPLSPTQRVVLDDVTDGDAIREEQR